MTESIEGVDLEGRCVRISARPPLPIEARVLALAVAIQVFTRYPLFDRVVLALGTEEVSLVRSQVERLTGPEGLAAAAEAPPRFRQVLMEALDAWDRETAS